MSLHRCLYLLKRRCSIWRTRSRDTPCSAASSSSVAGSSVSRRAVKMRRSTRVKLRDGVIQGAMAMSGLLLLA